MTEFEEQLNRALSDTFNTILKYEEECLKTIYSVPVTVTEAHMLEAIARINGGGATAGAIAAELDVAPSTVTVALKKLQQRGLVTKAQNERDARRLHVTLTHEGERINRAHALFHRKMVRDITDRLEDDELAALLSAVSKLNRYFNDRVGRKNG